MHFTISQAEPYQSVQVQRVDGGFSLVSPPDGLWVAQTPQECADTIAEWLGAKPPRSDSWVPGEAAVQCPVHAQFMVTKAKRARSKRGYVLSVHHACAESQHQLVCFNAIQVFECLFSWMTTKPEHATDSGVRVAATLDPSADGVFLVRALTSIAAFGPLGVSQESPPWVVECDDPEIRLGVTDRAVCAHFEVALRDDVCGYFAARLAPDGALEIGPRIADSDVDA